MVLFTLHNCLVSCSLDLLKLLHDSKSRLPISEFSGYHCIHQTDYYKGFDQILKKL